MGFAAELKAILTYTHIHIHTHIHTQVTFLVFDECDRLFEMGFAAELKAILKKVSEDRQTLLFSATLPAALAQFARAGLRDPELVRLDVDSKISENLRMAFLTIRAEERDACLMYLVKERINKNDQVCVCVLKCMCCVCIEGYVCGYVCVLRRGTRV